MKVAVVGLGAVGGLIAARLALAGHEVTALSRGTTLALVRAHGLRLMMDGVERTARLVCSGDASTLGRQDLVVLAVKPQALSAVAAAIQPLLQPDTAVLPTMNGVPWWFLQVAPANAHLSSAAQRLQSVDPDGQIQSALPLPHVLGCVVHLSCSSPEPGLVVHGAGQGLIVGEPAGGASPRLIAVCEALAEAGFEARASPDVRSDIWHKLWSQVVMNPVSALTGAHTADILDDPLVGEFVLGSMAEAAAIGAAAGCAAAHSAYERIGVTRRLGAVQTSMWQDMQAGRMLELDSLLGAVHEIGGRFNIAAPQLGALLGLTRLMARQRGLYRARPVPDRPSD